MTYEDKDEAEERRKIENRRHNELVFAILRAGFLANPVIHSTQPRGTEIDDWLLDAYHKVKTANLESRQVVTDYRPTPEAEVDQFLDSLEDEEEAT